MNGNDEDVWNNWGAFKCNNGVKGNIYDWGGGWLQQMEFKIKEED